MHLSTRMIRWAALESTIDFRASIKDANMSQVTITLSPFVLASGFVAGSSGQSRAQSVINVSDPGGPTPTMEVASRSFGATNT